MTIEAKPDAVLVGATPTSLPEHERIRCVGDLHLPLKIFCGNRYEHFVPTRDTVDHPTGVLRVFEWSHTTYVAE
ncbi:DUF5988 family protein [Streptomyces sp. NPDC059740]|uniref:DUF5988 family protein n=1 Tax=Streptomyces sp. NPDC059740 TaxID=3346926 RepID=UPI0036581544